MLEGDPGTACSGGVWFCDGEDAVACGDIETNACGGSVPLLFAPGAPCGACDDGWYVCAGPNQVACAGASDLNACGGCAVAPGAIGDACLPDHEWACFGGRFVCEPGPDAAGIQLIGDACETGVECENNLCVEVDGDGICSMRCGDDGLCPLGFECTTLSALPDGPELEACVPRPGCVDRDSDGYGVGRDCLGFDCDDDTPSVFFGAPEVCNERDDDCDGDADDNAVDAATWWLDVDNDGFGNPEVSTRSCTPLRGYVDNEDDCDDTVQHSFPGAPEICDGDDNDCDDRTDEDFATLGDSCSDGEGACEAIGVLVCNGDGTGVTCGAVGGEPDRAEICEGGVDEDCDGATDCDDDDCSRHLACVELHWGVAPDSTTTGPPGGLLTDAVTFRLLADGERHLEAGLEVTFEAPAGVIVDPPAGISNDNGEVTVSVLLPRQPGAFEVVATTPGIADATVEFSVGALEAGTIYPIVGAAGATLSPTADAALGREMTGLSGLAVADDGTLYLSSTDTDAVYAVSPAGVVSVLAGVPHDPADLEEPAYAGEGGAADEALLSNPGSLALSPDGLHLYIADAGHGRVRSVDLVDGRISLVLGDDDGDDPPDYGAGGTASGADPGTLDDVAAAADGTVYAADPARGWVWRVADGVAERGLPTSECRANVIVGAALEHDGTGGRRDAVAVGPTGALFVATDLCGRVPGDGTAGIARLDDDELAHVAGSSTGGSGAALHAAGARFTRITDLVFDTPGSAYVVDRGARRVLRIDGGDGATLIVAGTGSAGGGGDFGDATLADLDDPLAVGGDGAGNVYILDGTAGRVRMVAGAAGGDIGTATLEFVEGDGQEVMLNGPSDPVRFRVTGESGPLEGFPVWVEADDPAVWFPDPRGVTDADGEALVTVYVARALETYAYDAHIRTARGNSLDCAPGADGDAKTDIREGFEATSVTAPNGPAVWRSDWTRFMCYFDNRIRRARPDGSVATITGGIAPPFGNYGPAAAAFSGACESVRGGGALALDPSGRLVIGTIETGQTRLVWNPEE